MFTCNSILPNVNRKKLQAVMRRSMSPRETPRGFELLKIGAEFDVKCPSPRNKCANFWYSLFGNGFIHIKSNFLYISSKTLQSLWRPFLVSQSTKATFSPLNAIMDQEPCVFCQTR